MKKLYELPSGCVCLSSFSVEKAQIMILDSCLPFGHLRLGKMNSALRLIKYQKRYQMFLSSFLHSITKNLDSDSCRIIWYNKCLYLKAKCYN